MAAPRFTRHRQTLARLGVLDSSGRRHCPLRRPVRHRGGDRPGHGSNGADFTTLAVFVWPVLYAAVTFGPTGGTFTTALVAALSVPRLISFAQDLKSSSLLSESIQVLILSVIGLVVGRRVAAERVARLAADEARRGRIWPQKRGTGGCSARTAPRSC